jgi:hypothetical protein
MERADLRLAGRDERVAFHHFKYRRDPVLGHPDIRIEQDVIIGFDLPQREVIPRGKAMVFAEPDYPQTRMMFLQILNGAICRGIVGNDNFRVILTEFNDPRKEFLKELLPVPVQYDDGYFQ